MDGRTDKDRLAWALRFAQADLTTWREGDWLNAAEDALDLASQGLQPPAIYAGVPLIAPLLPLATALHGKSVDRVRRLLATLQRPLRHFIDRLEGIRTVSSPNPTQEIVQHAEVSFRGKCVFVAPFGRLSAVYVPTGGNLQKRFITGMLLRVGDLLTRIDLSRLKRCPECNRFFLAVRRQRFDTPQCSLRDRKRRFRQKLARTRRKRPMA